MLHIVSGDTVAILLRILMTASESNAFNNLFDSVISVNNFITVFGESA